MNGKWLEQKLAQNGFTPQDLADQTQLSLQTIQEVIADQDADNEVWDLILSTLNQYPRVIIPDAQVLNDLKNDIETYGQDAQCLVFYGVNQNQLAFCEYQCLEDQKMHGANVPTEYLSSLPMSLADALQLFTKQNFTAMQFAAK